VSRTQRRHERRFLGAFLEFFRLTVRFSHHQLSEIEKTHNHLIATESHYLDINASQRQGLDLETLFQRVKGKRNT